MKKIDISIIVPIYNAEKHLNKCIDSLVNQTKKEIELILVNDGSTDNTENIIKNYNDNRIKYFSNKNQGIGKTRNFGIEKAKGKYIMFCDSDDYYEKDACEKMFNKANEEKLDLVICDFFINHENGNITEERLPSFVNTPLKKKTSLIRTINLSPWNKIYLTKFIKDNNIKFEETLKYEDAPFVVEALIKANKIGKIDECFMHYLVHDNSETTIRDRRCFDIIKIVDIIREKCKNKEYLQEDLKKWMVRVITNYTIQQRYQVNKKDGMEFIDEAFNYMKKHIPDYKNNKYYESRGFLRRTIEKNKILTKIYCKIY